MPLTSFNVSKLNEKIQAKLSANNLEIPGTINGDIQKIINSEQFNGYLQQKMYSWVIQTFLVNARVQGHLTEKELDQFVESVDSSKAKEELAVSFLLSGVGNVKALKKFVELNSSALANIEPLAKVAHH